MVDGIEIVAPLLGGWKGVFIERETKSKVGAWAKLHHCRMGWVVGVAKQVMGGMQFWLNGKL